MKLIATLLLAVTLVTAYSQNNHQADSLAGTSALVTGTVTRAAGLQYAASKWKKWWWGEHYRREWTTPVSFPVLHISRIYGGLTPGKLGGGNQSKSLRLMSADGREYVLRTIDKSLDLLVPEYLKGSVVNDVVNDQISTAHPYAPLAIASLAEAAQILHTNPRIYYVAGDPLLGQFEPIFANRLALLEERPSGKGWKHAAAFGNADEIVNTENMLEEIYADPKNSVDQQSFLKVRLFDMVVNDWDRHEDQWVWAVKKSAGKNLYMPIGRDRDQAFARTDGVALFFLSLPWAFRPLKDFTPKMTDVKGLNFSARNLDQQFLNGLTKHQWKSVIDSLQWRLSDEAIENAVRVMPAEANHHYGGMIMTRLKQRRKDLLDAGMKYYAALSKKVTVNGTAQAETFIISLINRNQLAVTGVHAASSDTFYHRTFHRKETRQINLYALQGNNRFIVNADAKNRFIVRLISQGAQTEYITEAKKLAGKRIRIYDSLPVQHVARNVFNVNNRWDTLYRYNRTSVKYNWFIPVVRPGYNEDDGFSIELGIRYRKQQWGKSPFGWEQQFSVGYAAGTGAIGFEYGGLFKSVFGKWDLELGSFYKGPRYTFFYYGLGNETILRGNSRHFYRVKANNFYIAPGVSRNWGNHYLRFGLQYEHVDVLRNQDKYITSPASDVNQDVFMLKHYAGVNGKWDFFNAASSRYPLKGFHLGAGFSFMNSLGESHNRFVKLKGEATIYHTFFKRLTLAHRTGAATNFGKFDFYHANVLGLDHHLRGFWKGRFTGKSSFYQNTELRLVAAKLKGYYARGTLGVYGFFDNGRVWVENENSSRLHVGYGGGVYFLPYNVAAFTLFYSRSGEANMVTLRAGFFL
jgi:hypothetical protein